MNFQVYKADLILSLNLGNCKKLTKQNVINKTYCEIIKFMKEIWMTKFVSYILFAEKKQKTKYYKEPAEKFGCLS